METIQINSLEQVPGAINLIFKRFDELQAQINKPTQQPTTAATPSDPLRTRTECAKILRVTLATLHQYTLSGKIIANRIGNRVLYKDSDIQAALNKVKTSSIAA